MKLRVALLLALAAATCVSHADVLFDFEDQTSTAGTAFSPTWPGALHTLTSTKSGVSLTVTRETLAGVDGARFDVMSTAGLPFPASWGNNCLSPYDNTVEGAFHLRFSTPVTSLSFDCGNFGASAQIYTNAYSGLTDASTLVSSQAFTYDANGGLPFMSQTITLTLSAPVMSVYILGNQSRDNNAIYLDNVRAAAVPEPMSLGFLAVGAGALIRRRR